MGFADRTGGKYFTIMGGKCVVRVQEGTPGAVARKNKKDVIVHEVHHDSFEGKLVNIRTRETPFGKSWEFDFVDGGEVWTLQLPYSNSNSTALLKMLPNVDLTQPMKIQPSQKMEDGVAKSSLFVSQNGTTLKHAYTKDAPNGLPPMEQVTVKGQLVWDDSKRIDFLHAMVLADIIPKLPKTPVAPTSAESAMALDENAETADASDF